MSYRSLPVAICLVLLFPVYASAQACLGNGASPGQGLVSGGASFTDGAWALSGNVGGNLSGPASVQAGVAHTFFDNTDAATTSVGGSVAADVTSNSSPASLCPVAGASYQWLSNDAGLAVDADGIIVGGGVGIGTEIHSASGLTFIPQGSATLVHNRATVSGGGLSATDSETYGSFSGSLVMDFGSIYLGPSASITSLEGSDPVFSVTLGVVY